MTQEVTIAANPIARQLALQAPYFATLEGVAAVLLFGSHARGQAGPLSDVDVAVLIDASVPHATYPGTRLKLMGDLAEQLGHDDVDVVVLNEAPLALAYRVLRDGVLVYCRDRDHSVQFKARTVSQYLDFLTLTYEEFVGDPVLLPATERHFVRRGKQPSDCHAERSEASPLPAFPEETPHSVRSDSRRF